MSLRQQFKQFLEVQRSNISKHIQPIISFATNWETLKTLFNDLHLQPFQMVTQLFAFKQDAYLAADRALFSINPN